MEPDPIKVGTHIHQLRKRRQLTQAQLGERLHISFQAVSKWEKGLSDPSTSNLLALARLYGVSAEELLAADPAPDKKTRQMDWVRHMNALKAQAEEIVTAELINN